MLPLVYRPDILGFEKLNLHLYVKNSIFFYKKNPSENKNQKKIHDIQQAFNGVLKSSWKF